MSTKYFCTVPPKFSPTNLLWFRKRIKLLVFRGTVSEIISPILWSVSRAGPLPDLMFLFVWQFCALARNVLVLALLVSVNTVEYFYPLVLLGGSKVAFVLLLDC